MSMSKNSSNQNPTAFSKNLCGRFPHRRKHIKNKKKTPFFFLEFSIHTRNWEVCPLNVFDQFVTRRNLPHHLFVFSGWVVLAAEFEVKT
jgi:hypothetical protein